MKRRVSGRTRAMVLSCLNNTSNDEDDDSPDFYDKSRSSSPVQVSSGCLGLKEKLHKENVASNLHEETTFKEGVEAITNPDNSLDNLVNVKSFCAEASRMSPLTPRLLLADDLAKKMAAYPLPAPKDDLLTETAAEKCVAQPTYSPLIPCSPNTMLISHKEPPPHSPLTPCPRNAVSITNDDVLTETVMEKSIEPPPYSPLTPCPRNAVSVTHDNVLTETAVEKSIEPPPYSPLTPCPRNAMSVTHDDVLTETAVEKSIEPPPYSPLTPCPRNAVSVTHDDVLTETAVEKSIEPPPYSPLTPCPRHAMSVSHNNLLTKNAAENSVNSPFSPLPLMSPDTEKMFYILADSFEKDNTEDKSGTSTISNMSREEAYVCDSDDSVKDPDYYHNNDSSCHGSSNNSISSMSGIACTENTIQMPRERNEIASYRSDTVSPGPIGSQHQLAEVDDQIVPVPEPETISVNTPITVSVQDPVSHPQTDEECTGRPRKGRKRKFGGLSREDGKKRKYLNLSYVNSRKKTINPKIFVDFQCSCSKKCHTNITVEKRLAAFEKFYSLGSYDAQNMFLTSLVHENPVKRHYVPIENQSNVSKNKSYSRQYFLDGIPVCRDMFVKTLQTSAKRINTSLCKMRSESCADKRGLQSGHNKVSPEREQFVINFIKKLPTYISHYRREQSDGVRFLRADMTFSKIYELYCDEAKNAGMTILSSSNVKKIFLTKFNLRTKPLKKDTCNKCDFFESKILHASEENKTYYEQKQTAHQQFAKSLQTQMKSDMKLAKDDPSVETITFDLEKTLPLPRIPTNIVFYKRQLWVYNFGIHTGSKDEAHCNVWVEGEAGRGAQEVGSCLIKHITEKLNDNVKRLILWSDSCGGQNRNIKLTLMLKAMLNEHPTIEQINIRFLESGHSFLPNDTDFGKIESALNRQQRLYTPDDYMLIMKTCKKSKPMHVYRMKNEDFFSSLKLEKNIVNRKKTIDGGKVSWLNTKEIMLKKDEMFKIYMRSDFDEDFKEVDIKKKIRGREPMITRETMEPLWPTGKPISEAKLKDLKSLLHLIPQDSHDFYVKLIGDENVEDDLEGFSGQPDFEVEDIDNEN